MTLTQFDGDHKTPFEQDGCLAEAIDGATWTESDTDYEGTLYRRRFDSFRNFLDYCTNDRPDDTTLSSSTKEGDGDFREHDTWNEAIQAAEDGWDEGRERVLDIIESIGVDGLDMKGSKITHEHEVMGQRMDMGRYMTGDPECFVTRHHVEDEHTQGVESLEIIVNIGASCGVDREAIIHRGAAVAALAEVLQHLGVAVGITAVQSACDHGDDAVTYEVPVKKPEQPIDGDRLAFQLGNPDMLRRLMFAAEERDRPEVHDLLGYVYGYPCDAHRHTDNENTIYMGAMHYDDGKWERDGFIETWVSQRLEEQGVELDSA